MILAVMKENLCCVQNYQIKLEWHLVMIIWSSMHMQGYTISMENEIPLNNLTLKMSREINFQVCIYIHIMCCHFILHKSWP